MNKIRIGVIGAGRMGKNHCRVYSMLRHADLVGIYDMNRAGGQSLAQQYETRHFDKLEELLDAVDAVSIATPTPSHFEIAMLCLRRGKHVLIEKPMTETLEQARILAAAARQSGLVVQVGHIERFNPTYIELKHIVDNITPLVINFRRLSPYAGSNTDVDVVLDLMIHDIDLLLDLVGEQPLLCDANGIVALSGAIDHAVVTLKFAGGLLMTVTASRVTEQKVRSIEVTTREAYVEGDLLSKSIAIHHSTVGEYLNNDQRGVKYRQEGFVERIHVPSSEPLFLEIQHFVDCARNNTAPLVTAQQGLKTLELAMEIREQIHHRLNIASQPQLGMVEMMGQKTMQPLALSN